MAAAKHDWSVQRNPAHRLVVTAVRSAEQLTKAADRFLGDYGLTVAQFNLLGILLTEPHGIPQSRIGERLVVSRANVTGLVRRLKARGLCRTLPEPADSRIKRVVITPAGARLMDRIGPGYFREIDRLVRPLKDREMEEASRVLDLLQESLRSG
jgi:MarR family 2-MHQ and catechol resistance regulon transcriptional repressor